jgi:hypothetical protein
MFQHFESLFSELITASKLMDGAVNIMNTRTGILNARIAAVISDMCEGACI